MKFAKKIYYPKKPEKRDKNRNNFSRSGREQKNIYKITCNYTMVS